MDYRRRVASLANETSVVSVISGGSYWGKMSAMGGISSYIAAWTMIFMTFSYLCAGLLASLRYNQHARYKLRERERMLSITQSMGQNAVCVCVRVYGYICVCSLIAVAYLSFPLARTFSRSSLLDRSLLSATIAPPQFTVCAGQVGANFWIFWISILIPVLYVAIGAVVGFVMGITYGSILSGIMLQAAINVDEMMLFETQVLIGFAIACLLQLFAFAPPSVAVLFM